MSMIKVTFMDFGFFGHHSEDSVMLFTMIYNEDQLLSKSLNDLKLDRPWRCKLCKTGLFMLDKFCTVQPHKKFHADAL